MEIKFKTNEIGNKIAIVTSEEYQMQFKINVSDCRHCSFTMTLMDKPDYLYGLLDFTSFNYGEQRQWLLTGLQLHDPLRFYGDTLHVALRILKKFFVSTTWKMYLAKHGERIKLIIKKRKFQDKIKQLDAKIAEYPPKPFKPNIAVKH